ncbi:MAG: S-methyl-5'-thioadenosine phosphorylase, partial [Sphingomonadales bacterium]
REAELPYALVGMVTDYDCWREGDTVDVGQVVAQMQKNGKLARDMLARFINALPKTREASPIDYALDDAVITAPDKHDAKLLAKLDAVAGRLLGGA